MEQRRRKRIVSFLVILSLLMGMIGGFSGKKAEAGVVKVSFPKMDITMKVGEVLHVTFDPTLSERGLTNLVSVMCGGGDSSIAWIDYYSIKDDGADVKALKAGKTYVCIYSTSPHYQGNFVEINVTVLEDTPEATPTVTPTATPTATPKPTPTATATERAATPTATERAATPAPTPTVSAVVSTPAPLVTFQTEIMPGDVRVKYYFDKPLSAYGVDVDSITWWGYSDGLSGIVGIGSWTDEYVELTGNAPGTLTLNWIWYDRTTYQYGDYALKITVTVKEKQTATPTPAADVPAITPAPLATPTPEPAITPVPAATTTPEPDAATEPAVTEAPAATASPAASQAKVYKLSPATVTLTVGKKKTLSVGKKLTKKQKKTVKWSSADASVATVKSGKVTAKKTGVTTIFAKYQKKTYQCTVFVDPKASAAIGHKTFTKTKQAVTVKKDQDTVLGNVEKDAYSITLPAGTFGADTKVAVQASGTGIDFRADGRDGVRLEEPVTISMKLEKKIPASEVPYYYVVYKKDGKEYLIDPDPEELRKGYAVFQTDHFSLYDFVKPGIKQVIKHKAYYAAASHFTADAVDALMEKAFQKSFDKLDQTLDRIMDKLSDGKLDRTDSFMKKHLKKSLLRDVEFISMCRGLATGDAKTTVKGFIDLCAKKICNGLEKDKSYKKLRAAGMALPEFYKQWKSGNKLAATKAVSDAVSGEIDEVAVTQFAYELALIGRETYNDYNIQNAVQGLLGTEAGKKAGYKGEYDITKDEEWEDFKNQDMKGAWRLYRETEMEKWRESKRAGCDLSKEEKQTPGVLDERLIKYSKQNYYTDPELAEERRSQEERISRELRGYLLSRLEQEQKIREEAAKLEEQIAAYINVGLFGYEDELDYSEEEYAARITALTEIKEMVEAKFDGSSPAQIEGYDEKTAYSVNCRRYAEFVKLYVDANKKAGDETGAAGIRALTGELAKRYGLGIEITPQKFTMEIGDTDSFTVIVDGLFDIISQCKLTTFDKKAATVSKTGEIKALADGAGDIKVEYGKKTHKVHVLVGEGNLHIAPKGNEKLETGNTQNLTLKKEDGTNVAGTPEWKSSDEKVLKVSKDGKVSTVKAGKATVTATYNKREYTKEFTVSQRVEMSRTRLTLTVGDGHKLTLLGAGSGKVSWGFKGSAGIISLTQKGKVTAKSAGKVTVIAEYKGIKYTCVVTVKKKVKKEKTNVNGYYYGIMKINSYAFSATPVNTYERKGNISVEAAGNGTYNIVSQADSKTGVYMETYGSKGGVSGSAKSISFSDEYNTFHCNGTTATWTHYVYAVNQNDGTETKLVEWTITATKKK